MWSRSQSFPDSQKFSTTSLFGNSSCRRWRGSIVRRSKRDPNSVARSLRSGPTGPVNREDNPEDFPSVKRLEESGSWLSHVKPIPTFSFRRPGVRQWRIVHVLEKILVITHAQSRYTDPRASLSNSIDRWKSIGKSKLRREENPVTE